jgi:hypothetical protein
VRRRTDSAAAYVVPEDGLAFNRRMPYVRTILAIATLAIGLVGMSSSCGDSDCGDLLARWQNLSARASEVACTADSDCEVVGQSGSCGCSSAIAPGGVAVNTRAYSASGGDDLEGRLYRVCSDSLPAGCDFAPAGHKCTAGRCAAVFRGGCGMSGDGGVRMPLDTRPLDTSATGIDAPAPTGSVDSALDATGG